MVVLHFKIPNIIMHIFDNQLVDSYRVRRNQFNLKKRLGYGLGQSMYNI